mmetsp:Transcript_20199/g.49689  ORF Transcript_20199/g.49689 Transcript_20199/m.49689 type:complete len:230 (+) Transcript_20199:167-856(+)
MSMCWPHVCPVSRHICGLSCVMRWRDIAGAARTRGICENRKSNSARSRCRSGPNPCVCLELSCRTVQRDTHHGCSSYANVYNGTARDAGRLSLPARPERHRRQRPRLGRWCPTLLGRDRDRRKDQGARNQHDARRHSESRRGSRPLRAEWRIHPALDDSIDLRVAERASRRRRAPTGAASRAMGSPIHRSGPTSRDCDAGSRFATDRRVQRGVERAPQPVLHADARRLG